MKIRNFLIPALATVTFISSCSSDDDITEMPEEETGEYAKGVLILNEGNFGSGNSTVSFIDENLEDITNDIFGKENQGDALGDTGQSIGFYEDYAFIVMNVSNKIEVVNRFTFESVASIDSGLENPRYIIFSNENAYVTNWGDGTNPDDDFVAVIDLANFSLLNNIEVAEGPETLIAQDGKVYVAHLGGYSFNNKISVINAGSNTVEEIVQVGDRPNSMEIEDGYLWVSCSGLPGYAEQETAGKIVKIDLASLEISHEFEFENFSDHPGNLRIDNDIVYYTIGASVYTFNDDDENLPESAFFELDGVASLYGFEVDNGKIYAASANSDFTGNGDVFIYDAVNGEIITDFEGGINPNGIFFNR